MNIFFPLGWKSYGEMRRDRRMYLRRLAKQGPLWREVYAAHSQQLCYQG